MGQTLGRWPVVFLLAVSVTMAAMILGARKQEILRRQTMMGFSSAGAQAEWQLEERYKAIPSAEEARKHHRFLTAEPRRTARVNRLLMQVEANWLNPEGIPGLPWFKHILYAARYTYAHLELPGLTEAVEKGDWKMAREQAAILEKALAKNAALLRDARAEIGGER